ncbi:MAG TPA: HDOD domain-containing protein [Fimbriimonadaceae bacterium]|nr:HDOD domain-containing protein [Fimbriimonadaceae bacterium]
MSALPIDSLNDPLAELLEKVDGLAVLPHVVFKVLEISASEDAPPLDLERAIIVDPGFSSKVLTLANSAFFGLPRRVTSIREAILFLGFRAVRSLAMTVGTYDMFVGKSDKESLRRRAWWRHSVDTAVCSKALAFFTRKAQADDCYTCGLLHLIGKTLLDRFGNGDYDRVAIMTATGVPELDAESRVFGCNHIDVAISAAERWGFPQALVSGLSYLTQPDDDDAGRMPRACTALGSALANIAQYRQQHPGEEDGHELPQWALDLLGIGEERVEMVVEQSIGAIAAAQLHLG